ncbi:MAG: helix-turn-helix transcriptional regulator [Bacteroidetes bacterium]|nr:helix-turn-helix transcriptional regulator [Bacteroidota bacterium]
MKKTLGQILKRERKKRKLSQEEIADKLNTDKQYISNVENGRKNITIEQLELILLAIGADHKDILKLK